MEVKYPGIEVDLTRDCNGNAFSIMGAVTRAMRRAGISKEEQDAFRTEAMSGDYDNFLQTCMRWVNC